MTRKARGLGRGLDALFSGDIKTDDLEIIELETSLIVARPDQPRRSFDEENLQELAASIKEHGVLQPLVVREKGDNYEIVAGERRWRAAILAGLKTVPVIIRDIDDLQASEIALIENLQREDLTAVEEAMAYKQIIEKFNYTQEELAQKIGKSRAYIANTLRILNLPPSIIEMIASRKITAGHARAILGYDNKNDQIAAAQEIVSAGLSVREAEKRVKKKRIVEKFSFSKTPEVLDLEERMQKFFGTKAEIIENRHGGKIEITYYSSDDLLRIIELLGI